MVTSLMISEILELLDSAMEEVDVLKVQAKEGQDQDSYDTLNSALTYLDNAVKEINSLT